MNPHELEEVVERLGSTVERLADVVERMDRAILGAPDEGNIGILPRLTSLEKRVERLWWAFPFLVTGGTALGQVVAKWIGL